MIEDPLLKRTRIEAAHALSNSIIDVINTHVRLHGKDDPQLAAILIAALAAVVSEINAKVDEDFGAVLGEALLEDDF